MRIEIGHSVSDQAEDLQRLLAIDELGFVISLRGNRLYRSVKPFLDTVFPEATERGWVLRVVKMPPRVCLVYDIIARQIRLDNPVQCLLIHLVAVSKRGLYDHLVLRRQEGVYWSRTRVVGPAPFELNDPPEVLTRFCVPTRVDKRLPVREVRVAVRSVRIGAPAVRPAIAGVRGGTGTT